MRRRRRAERGARLGVAALALAGAACGGADSGGVELVRHDHYRVTFEVESPATLDGAGTLRVRVAPRGGWKVAPEAPVRLELEAPEALAFEPASPGLPEGAAGEDGFELVTVVRAYQSGPVLARGRLRFGICEGPAAVCVAVDRELEIPIEVAFDG